jgi:hypothetical protein
VWLGNAKWSEMPAWGGVKLSGNVVLLGFLWVIWDDFPHVET